MGDSVVASDSLVLETSQDAILGAWWFETVIAGTEWDPVLFTKILNDCRPKLHQTLDKSSIFSYACREHSTIIVPAGQVAIKGFLKMLGSYKVRLGTLQRRLQHDSTIGNINWIPIEVGQTKRYTAHERIQNFLQQTALPPAGVLQSISVHRRHIEAQRIQISSFSLSFFTAARNVKAHRRVWVHFQLRPFALQKQSRL